MWAVNEQVELPFPVLPQTNPETDFVPFRQPVQVGAETFLNEFVPDVEVRSREGQSESVLKFEVGEKQVGQRRGSQTDPKATAKHARGALHLNLRTFVVRMLQYPDGMMTTERLLVTVVM